MRRANKCPAMAQRIIVAVFSASSLLARAEPACAQASAPKKEAATLHAAF